TLRPHPPVTRGSPGNGRMPAWTTPTDPLPAASSSSPARWRPGKSTVAELLARRLPRSAHVRGDAFRRMVVNGRADMTPQPTPEADAQLQLRYDLATHTADTYARHGFDAIVQDVVIGAH